MKTIKKLAVLITVLLLVACGSLYERISGVGDRVLESREIGSVHTVSVSVPATTKITQGNQSSLSIYTQTTWKCRFRAQAGCQNKAQRAGNGIPFSSAATQS